MTTHGANEQATAESEPEPGDTQPETHHTELVDLIGPVFEAIDSIASNGALTVNIPTGFSEFDEVTSGLPQGSLTVIAGSPGVGSSTFALDIARAAAIKHNIPAAFLTLDSKADTVTQKLLSAEAKVRIADIRSGRMSDDDWTRLAECMQRIHEAPIVIERPTSREITDLASIVVDLMTQIEVRLVVIDSLHLITARDELPYENREREVAEVVRRLKHLALATNTAIVVTAQLSTNPGPRQPFPVPVTLADLRDSGTIAHVADHVILIHRPDAWERDSPRGGEVDLHMAKNRHGPTFIATVAHQLHLCRFVDMARH